MGVTVCDDALRRAVDVIVGALRESDFIAVEYQLYSYRYAGDFSEGSPSHTRTRISTNSEI
jgi:hypothetical protein